jgi:hypothetical protein
MTLKDRDRLVVLKKAQKRLITQREAAEELRLTERHARRLLRRLINRSIDVWLQRSDGSRVGPADTDRRFIQRGGAPTVKNF